MAKSFSPGDIVWLLSDQAIERRIVKLHQNKVVWFADDSVYGYNSSYEGWVFLSEIEAAQHLAISYENKAAIVRKKSKS